MRCECGEEEGHGYIIEFVLDHTNRGMDINDDEEGVSDEEEEISGKGGLLCCDVSWISKYPDEQEILIARSISGGNERGWKFVRVGGERCGLYRIVLE